MAHGHSLTKKVSLNPHEVWRVLRVWQKIRHAHHASRLAQVRRT
jgi:hypothetical protein